MKISIIVPIYNIENYIEKCLTSIINQTYNNYELILVNDGSTDSSETICKKIAKENKQIKYFYKKNGGLSDARNYGIRKSSGEYLMFVDGDDFLESKDSLKKIVSRLESSSLDVLQYKMKYYYENGGKNFYFKDFPNLNIEKTLDKLNLLNEAGQMSISACDKIVKASIIKENNLYFKKGLLSEDIDWSLRVYLKINSIDVINETIYVYRQQRDGSITTKRNIKRNVDLYTIIKKWMDYKYQSVEFKELYYNYISYQMLILLSISKKKDFSKEEWQDIKERRKILINYKKNYKVKITYPLVKIFGFSLAILILKLYLLVKNKGVLKL